jgi:uncharacterized protein
MASIDTTESGVDTAALAQKEARLRDLIGSYASVAVAYSGGVDSSYLAFVANDVLGRKATMVLADSPSIPRSEVDDAVTLARERKWNLMVVRTTEFENEAYLKNDSQRCYFCKTALFEEMTRYAHANNVNVLAYGVMADDDLDDRPGHRAAEAFRVAAPLQEVLLGKDEIRELSRREDLPTASKASFACLSSRFPTGSAISVETIGRVEQAEEVLRSHGFHQFRARHHDDICRIEVDPQELDALLQDDVREDITRRIKSIGYRFVTIDLAGYRMGSVARRPDAV